MLELEVVPEHGLCSDTIEFVLGKLHFYAKTNCYISVDGTLLVEKFSLIKKYNVSYYVTHTCCC